MSHSSSHFLTLDANKKPSVRKGVNFQSYIPPTLPGQTGSSSKASKLNKVHVAIDVKVNATMERVTKTLPDMGPFNTIAPEIAVAFLEAQEISMKEESEPFARSSTYWDAFEESLDKMVKQENVDEGSSQSSTFSLEALRGLLSRLEAWNERSIKATLGTGQVLSSEVDELLEEARIIGQRVELPGEVLAKLRVLQKVGDTFTNKVRSKLTLKGKEKVPLRVLTDFMKEAEALPIETEEVRFFRNQRGRIQALCHSAQKASRDKSLEKSKDVTVEAAEIRAILPDLQFVQAQVSMAEWVQKAMAKTDKRTSVPLQTIEQLFEDPSAALIKPEDCEVMQVLLRAMNEGKEWQARSNKILSGIPESRTSKRMPNVDDIQALLDEHNKLSKVCVPALSAHIEGILRRAKGWLKKQERTLSGTWSLVDAKSLLEEGKQLSAQVDLNPQFGDLVREVSKAEEWCGRARTVLTSLSLTDIDQLEPLVNSSFKAPKMVSEVSPEDTEGPLTKRVRRSEGEFSSRLGLNGKEVQALKNYESSLADLTGTLNAVESRLIPLLSSEKLPLQADLVSLKDQLGIVRDLSLEEDVNQLCEGAIKWHDRAEAVLSVPFPRPAGVLRSLATLIHDLAANPMRYVHWKDIVEVAKTEVWAHRVRYVSLPTSEADIEQLVLTCPFEADCAEESAEVSQGNLQAIETRIANSFQQWQEEWMRDVLGLTRRDGARGDEMVAVRYAQAVRERYTKQCDELLVARRNPMHTRTQVETFMKNLLDNKLVRLDSLISRVQVALDRNAELEQMSADLSEKLRQDFEASSPHADLFHELLQLLEAVENAEIQVIGFDARFTPIVAKLLQYQLSVRELFKWDHDERITAAGYRPSLEALEQLWSQISTEAREKFKLSENFMRDVAYLASAVRALYDARAWRTAFSTVVEHLRKPLQDRISISALKKHVSVWPGLAVEAPYADILSNDDMARIDEWFKEASTTLFNRARNREQCLLDEAVALHRSAPKPLCTNSADYLGLEELILQARALRESSIDCVKRSFADRTSHEGGENSDDSFVRELSTILNEIRKSAIAPGTESICDNELRARTEEKLMRGILARPNVVPVDQVEAFLQIQSETESSCQDLIEGVHFRTSSLLKNLLSSRITETYKWNNLAHQFLSQLPPHHQVALPAPTGGARRAPQSGANSPSNRASVSASTDQAIKAALSSPPTAAGEKILDIVLRTLERDLAAMGEFHVVKNPVPEYLYPLPLYQLPPSAPSTPQPAAVAPARKAGSGSRTNKTSTSQASLITPENPLMLKGLSSMHQLLYQVPWTRPALGYLSPVNEVLLKKGADWIAAERDRFTQKISRPGLSLMTSLELLVEHKRLSLLQTTEYVKLRGLAAQSLRAYRTAVNRFPLLYPRDEREEAEIPLETWERVLQPSASPNADLEDAVQGSSTSAAQKGNEEVELVGILLQFDSLALQIPAKFRLLMLMLDMYDWRVRAQSVSHHMERGARPRPWAGDRRSLTHWAAIPPASDIFSQQPIASMLPFSDPLCLHVVPLQPPREYILCRMHMSFYYVIECCRHFIRVMSDMCELCYSVTTTDQEEVFWISCDVCDKWYHGRCAGLAQAVNSFTCPKCVLANANMTVERKRLAMRIIESMPAKRFEAIDDKTRLSSAADLLADAKRQQIIVTCNPVEIGIFKRIVPS
jgi:hypothetical protein